MHFEDNNNSLLISMPMHKAYFRIIIFKRVIGSLKAFKITNFPQFSIYDET